MIINRELSQRCIVILLLASVDQRHQSTEGYYSQENLLSFTEPSRTAKTKFR